MLRLLTKSDLPMLLVIEQLTQLSPWTQEIFERCWDVGYQGWVVESQEKIVGFIIVSFQAGESHILNLAVHPEFQRQGFAEKLMQEAMQQAKSQHISTAFLEVRKTNIKAIALYEKLGFIQIGDRKGYYPCLSGREDALIFAKDLTV